MIQQARWEFKGVANSMDRIIIAPPHMLEALRLVENPKIPPLDNALLQSVARACQSGVGPSIRKALHGQRRVVFENLCSRVADQAIYPAVLSRPQPGTGQLCFIGGLLLMPFLATPLLYRVLYRPARKQPSPGSKVEQRTSATLQDEPRSSKRKRSCEDVGSPGKKAKCSISLAPDDYPLMHDLILMDMNGAKDASTAAPEASLPHPKTPEMYTRVRGDHRAMKTTVDHRTATANAMSERLVRTLHIHIRGEHVQLASGPEHFCSQWSNVHYGW